TKKILVDNDKCIVCGKNILTTCSYCFFLKAGQVLLEMNFPEEFVKEFLKSFDYAKGHTEYELV
ncbi:MAG: hypothetical protein ACOCUU_03175, partial [Nanoarchaeota archaeon]